MISVRDDIGYGPVEYSVRVLSFRKYLPKGPTEGGGFRELDLVQVWTDPGGMRTLATHTITLGRRKRTAVERRVSRDAHLSVADEEE